jgi:hypothetical protein
MGRSASHIALECALETQPNVCLISEEVEQKEMSLDDVVTYIAQIVADRAADGNNFGTVLIPEGLIEFIPAIKKLIQQLNEVLTDPATGESREFASAEEQIAFVKGNIAPENLAILESLPADVARQLCLDRDTYHYKQQLSVKMGELIYDGKWFTTLMDACMAFVDKTQETVTGWVKLKLYKGSIRGAGSYSKYSLYNESIASFTTGDLYNHKDAEGFITLFGLPLKVRAMMEQQVGEGQAIKQSKSFKTRPTE